MVAMVWIEVTVEVVSCVWTEASGASEERRRKRGMSLGMWMPIYYEKKRRSSHVHPKIAMRDDGEKKRSGFGSSACVCRCLH
jgi:hypothetical protein